MEREEGVKEEKEGKEEPWGGRGTWVERTWGWRRLKGNCTRSSYANLVSHAL